MTMSEKKFTCLLRVIRTFIKLTMSRGLKTDSLRKKRHTVDPEAENKIHGPIIWRRLPSGYKIQDLKPKYYDQVLDMIGDYYVTEDILFRNTKFKEDKISQKSFRERLLFNMKDECSIIAMEERSVCKDEKLESLDCSCEKVKIVKEDILAGVLLLKTIKKYDMGRSFSTSYLAEGKPYQSIINFVNNINKKVDIFDQFQCNIYLRYYLICIKPEHRRKGLGYELMNIGLDVARYLNIPIVMGIFNCFKLQKLAKILGMQTIYELEYVDWVDKSHELIFVDSGAGNYTCAIMVGNVLPPPEPEPVLVVENELKNKLAKNEKKKKKK